MTPSDSSPPNQQGDSATSRHYPRRKFLALSAGIGVTMTAGCSTQVDSAPGDTEATTADETTPTDGLGETSEATGTFRLLVSDQPTAIGDFDRLDVSLDRARVFPGDNEEQEEKEAEATEDEEDEEAEEEEKEAAEGEEEDDEEEAEAGEEDEQEDANDGEQRGFLEIDLTGVTVDLTEVVGERALGVFNGELPAGRYTKIELHVANVEGIVEGEEVNVKVPSEKLQITKPFEVVAGETLTFVFDINVVKKGQTGEYNLLPVISKSGVAGQDVEVEEVESDDSEDRDVDQDENGGNGNESDGGPPDDAGGDA